MVMFSKTDLGTLPHLRWSSLQQLVMVGFTTNEQYCSNSTIFSSKIKIRWKWPCLEGSTRYDFLFCRHVFIFFQKRQLLSASLTFCFILKINYKNETWYHYQFHLLGFINRSNYQHIFWKMLFTKCRKNSCEGGFCEKIKTEINFESAEVTNVAKILMCWYY